MKLIRSVYHGCLLWYCTSLLAAETDPLLKPDSEQVAATHSRHIVLTIQQDCPAGRREATEHEPNNPPLCGVLKHLPGRRWPVCRLITTATGGITALTSTMYLVNGDSLDPAPLACFAAGLSVLAYGALTGVASYYHPE